MILTSTFTVTSIFLDQGQEGTAFAVFRLFIFIARLATTFKPISIISAFTSVLFFWACISIRITAVLVVPDSRRARGIFRWRVADGDEVRDAEVSVRERRGDRRLGAHPQPGLNLRRALGRDVLRHLHLSALRCVEMTREIYLKRCPLE